KNKMDKLSAKQIEEFIELGYVKIENAFSKDIADSCRAILWEAVQLSPDKPETWTQPVIRIGELGSEPFKQAANTPILLNAFNQLAFDNWLPRLTIGTFPIRFPSKEIPNDTGWHVDAGFPGDYSNDYLEWKINSNSKGRTLLMLFLFSDTTELDAPTRIKVGSHLDVAKLLMQKGEEGLTFMQLADELKNMPHRQETTATGDAGTVYLCHPFLVHAAQQHKGIMPKFMAQPALLSKRDFNINQPLKACCPIERAIIKGIEN
ncbi:MAG TPA: phytanoyl-CoA dioxygenase family protein, partial [Saprospiraceae bacterium]|nr:phytanoyl-CoA dioxygenase family protein [Saprospiraceae bacterium]